MQSAFKSFLLTTLPLSTLGFLVPINVNAQITPDDTLGNESSKVTPLDSQGFPVDRIDGGAVRDANLFHSFQDFNIGAGRGAYFTNPVGIANIFSRITGSNPSNLLGTLGVLGNANLFLLNPNGIFFGDNAALDLRGSFFASTADSLVFDNGFEFSASNPQSPPLLTVSIPIGANFRDNPGDIVNNSNANGVGLSVPQGNNIALIGGNVVLNNGNITAQGGKVELGGLSAVGEVKISNDNTLIFPDGVTRADVSITNNSVVAVSLAEGGTISINARNLELSNSFLLAGVQNSATLEERAANITINATEKFKIEGNQPTLTTVSTAIINNGGNITINTGSLEGIGNFNLNSSSFGQKNSGDITIAAKEGIFLQGIGITLQGTPTTFIGSIAASATGNSGNIIITTPLLSLSNISIGASSNGQGDAGNIQINTIDSISLNNSLLQTSSLEEGNAGNITIESEQGNVSFDATRIGAFAIPSLGILKGGTSGDITIKGQSILFTNSANVSADNDGTNNAGNITLEALDSIFLKNISQISSNTGGQGNGGNINITTKSLSIEDGSRVSASTLDEGDAGSIVIKATDSISFNKSSGILSNVDPGAIANGGDIQLEANSISFSNSSGLTASTLGIGNAGNITVNADSLTLDKFSAILAFNTPPESLATNLSGGNIALTIADNLILRNNSAITALAGANANGGNVNINTNFLIAFSNQNNDITANAFQGRGGNIDLTAESIFGIEERPLNPFTNDINASSQFGLQGGISINTPDVDPRRGLIELPQAVGDPSDQISQNPCEQTIGSEFIITGKGGIPPSPHDNLSSDVVRVDLIEPVATRRQGEGETRGEDVGVSVPEEIVPAQGWVFNDKGEVMLTAYDPTNTAAKRSWQQPINSCPAR